MLLRFAFSIFRYFIHTQLHTKYGEKHIVSLRFAFFFRFAFFIFRYFIHT
jgi:hypothetical protein